MEFTLDDRPTREAALADPIGFVAGLEGPVFIDEIQRAPDLLLAIKDAVDRRPVPGRFLLTGSADVAALHAVKDALTGRMETVHLWPLAQSEINGTTANFVDALFTGLPPVIAGAAVGKTAIAGPLAAGGYPEARLRTARRRARWFMNYLDTTLNHDIRDISSARKLEHLPLTESQRTSVL